MTRAPSPTLELAELSEEFAVCRLSADAPSPAWAEGDFVSVTRTGDELSVTCRASAVPADVQSEGGWTCFKIAGPLDFAEIGIVASLAVPLALGGIGIFVVSTFDTDYLLVKSEQRDRAVASLRAAGHSIAPSASERTAS